MDVPVASAGSDRSAARARLFRPALARALFLVDLVLLLATGTLWISERVPVGELADAYLIGNAAIGTSFAVCGAVVATRVPDNRLGWLMLGGGSLYVLAAASGTMAFIRIDSGDGGTVSRVLALIFVTVWMPAIAVGFPLVLQMFPTGRPMGRWGRILAVATVFVGVGATLGWIVAPDLLGGIDLDDRGPLLPERVGQALTVVLGPAMPLAGLMVLLSMAVPVMRLIRRRGEERLQVMWLAWAASVFLLANIPGFLARVPPPVPLLTLPLIPAAMTVAILRYRLYGIRLVINRTLVYSLLTALLLGLYVLLTVGIGRLIERGPVPQLAATGAVAVAFAPLRSWLQNAVDRFFFGERTRPYTALVRLGRQLETPMAPAAVLPAIAATVATALRLPYVRVTAGHDGDHRARVVEHGTPSATLVDLPLTYRGESVGALTVGLPVRETTLDEGRAGLLDDLRRQAGPAVHAVVLTDDLLRSRERTVAALEEERRRIRRDLHDGIGPTLTAAALKADAARNLLHGDQVAAMQLLDDILRQNRAAIDDIRRLVYGLRPPALDDLGLVGALRQYAQTLTMTPGATAVRIEVIAPVPLPPLPAAVEVAAYRIAAEAIANVLRHASASHAEVLIRAEEALHIEVADDGSSPDPTWQRGVGLISMRERAEELGGTCTAGPTPAGGRVRAILPLELP